MFNFASQILSIDFKQLQIEYSLKLNFTFGWLKLKQFFQWVKPNEIIILKTISFSNRVLIAELVLLTKIRGLKVEGEN